MRIYSKESFGVRYLPNWVGLVTCSSLSKAIKLDF